LKTKKLTLLALLAAIALTIFMLEAQIPSPVPIPGVKLGLANIVTVFTVFVLGPKEGAAVLAVRVFLGAVFAGNMNALIFSLLGGFSAMLVMILLSRSRHLSIYGVSIGGAAAHNIGQMAAALITLGNTAVLGYLPFLLAVSLFTGALTGFVSALLLRAMSHVKLSHGRSADNG